MKQNDIKALRDKSVAELMSMGAELEKKLADVRLQHKSGKQPKVSTTLLADDLARVKTVLSSKRSEE